MKSTEQGARLGRLRAWRGTAEELAEECNRLLPRFGLGGPPDAASERLIRYYVQEGVLTAPEPEGRKAFFGFRQLLEFLAARHLVRDGWPLAKIAELLHATDEAGLTELVPAVPPETPAQAALARIRATGIAGEKGAGRRPRMTEATIREEAVAYGSRTLSPAPEAPMARTIARAAGLTQWRTSLKEGLVRLGNAEGTAERKRSLRISLAPWCHVYIDVDELHRMEETTPGILGEALTQALQEERRRKGKSS